MKYTKTIFASIISLGLVACGGVDDEENVETQTSEETTNEELESELEPVTVEDLGNEDFRAKIESTGGILIDVRTADEYAEGHIEGALNLDFLSGQFESSIDTLDTGKAVLVYCQAGGRSGKARDLLKDSGFIEIYNLAEGYGNWAE